MKKSGSCNQCGKTLNRWQKKYCSLKCCGIARRSGEVEYTFSNDGATGYGRLLTGETFLFDSEDFKKICEIPWYRNKKGTREEVYVVDSGLRSLHRVILEVSPYFVIDHINMDPLDNRKCNLRICTHRQNLCNRPPQSNNTSGIPGVSFKKNRNTWNARIKYYGKEIHLGAYKTFIEAVQARNEGMRWIFAEFGRYNDVPDAPPWIKEYVKTKCSHFLMEMAVFGCDEGAAHE